MNPLLTIVAPLAAGFLIPLIGRLSRDRRTTSIPAAVLFYAALAVLVGVPAVRLPSILTAQAAEIFTAGFQPPLSINLRLGGVEVALLALINIVGFLVALSLHRRLTETGTGSMVLFLMILLGANGLVMTRDLFNTFVFMEILAIGTYGLIALDDRPEQFAAGFKYLIAGGISSVLFLLGTVYLYRITGTLNIDGMIEAVTVDLSGAQAGSRGTAVIMTATGFTATFLVLMGLLIELKPWPANGWALDAYQAAHPGVAAMLSAVNATAGVFVLAKLTPLFPAQLLETLLWVGALTFVAANVMGLRQFDVRRMLGYSSVAQIGLITAVLALIALQGLSPLYLILVAGGLLVTHAIAKAGLFMIAGAFVPRADQHGAPPTGTGGAAPVAHRLIGAIGSVGVMILAIALVGLPPFPSFFAKWQLVNTLVSSGRIAILVLILAGTLAEAVYLLRWAGGLVRATGARAMLTMADGVEHTGGTAGVRLTVVNVAARLEPASALAVALFSATLIGSGMFSGWFLGVNDRAIVIPLAATLSLLLLEWLPGRIKALLGIALVGAYAWYLYPLLSGAALIFAAVFAGTGVLVLIGALYRSAPRHGTYPLYVLTITSLMGLTVAPEPLTFLLLWELMTVGSYLLIVRSRGREGTAELDGPEPQPITHDMDAVVGQLLTDQRGSAAAALRYVTFSIGGALLLMVGLVIAQQGVLTGPAGTTDGAGAAARLPEIYGADGYALFPPLGKGPDETVPQRIGRPGQSDWYGPAVYSAGGIDGDARTLGAWRAALPHGARVAAFILIGLGFLVKLAAVGVHVWIASAYRESDDDVTTLFSAGLSKAGLVGVVLLALMLGGTALGGGAPAGGLPLDVILGWIGVATALFGALIAVFQEDVKRLMAYSSISQVGYMVAGFALATHLGWTAGIYLAVIHAIFKLMLFLGIAGVILRTGTSTMYRMGGLIKRMPVTFLSALMAIIAVSGVPPLAGFGGKWLIYSAMIEAGWYVQVGVAFFASTIAFLYLFRFIHTVFLGQLKDEHRSVREAPPALLIPQVLAMAGLMAVSLFPNLILKPIMTAVEPVIAGHAAWDGVTVISTLGYWNGSAVMYVTMGVFAVPLLWILLTMRRPRKIEQFNMVYAAERPERPETTHFAHNFFAPYKKALGFLVAPGVAGLWGWVRGAVAAVGGTLRRLYTGNGQTYALHILLLTVVLYAITALAAGVVGGN